MDKPNVKQNKHQKSNKNQAVQVQNKEKINYVPRLALVLVYNRHWQTKLGSNDDEGAREDLI